MVYSYIKRLGIAISILLNVIFGGDSNQTFSARNYGWKREQKLNLVWTIDLLFRVLFKDDDHCLQSWVYWYVRTSSYEVTSEVQRTSNDMLEGLKKIDKNLR